MRRLKRSECCILRLVLKREWFDMIDSGEKKEEYRDASPYWETRFRNFQWKCCWHEVDSQGVGLGRRPVAVVAFSMGYAKASMFYTIRFTLADGNGWEAVLPGGGEYWAAAGLRNCAIYPQWGETATPHYVIRLGDRVELED